MCEHPVPLPGDQVEVVLLQHHQPRKWHQQRRRRGARGQLKRLAVGTQPVLSQQQLLEAVERSVISGKPILKKLDKTDEDHARDAKRQQLLAFLNDAY